jgi:hypothetical protein
MSLIVPRARLARGRDLPPFFAELNPAGGIFLEVDWYDAHLWCETTMDHPGDMVEAWQARGLERNELCLAASGRGPERGCDWLEYDAADNCVWLRGTGKGAVIGGAAQLAERTAALQSFVEQAERAYAAMYEARRPRDDYDDACGGLMKAIEVARFLHRPDEIERLEQRLAHVRAVYRGQFVGF